MSVFYLINWHVDLFIWVSCIMMFPAPMGLKTWDSSGCHMTNHYTVSQIYKRMFEKKHFHDRNVLLSLIYFYKSINLSLLNLSLWDNLSKSGFFNSFFFVSKPIIPVVPVHGAMQHKIKFILNNTEITKDIKTLIYRNSLN